MGNTTERQGALIRVYACYTTPRDGVAARPCVYGPATRLNVLQQSALPAIVEQPRSMLIRTAQTANFSVTATGLPAPTLQWQTRPANSNGAWSNVATGTGATTAQYISAPLALADNGVQFRVVATNALGSAESNAVSISVSDLDVAPTITTQPGSLSVASGSDAVFAVNAHGTEALSYQWYRNGTALAGANSPVLRLTGVTTLNAGNFTVTVSNAAGDADSNVATLNVVPGTPVAVAPTIVTQPSSVVVNAGNTATFAVGVDGTGPFTFQWRRNGTTISGATSAVLSLNSARTEDMASYSVLVSNTANPTGVASNPAEPLGGRGRRNERADHHHAARSVDRGAWRLGHSCGRGHRQWTTVLSVAQRRRAHEWRDRRGSSLRQCRSVLGRSLLRARQQQHRRRRERRGTALSAGLAQHHAAS